MKNRKLYDSIQKLVTNKESTKKTKPNFAEEYCKEQIRKKKLTRLGSTSKLDNLLKNFKTIKTYIDVDDLIECVNEQYVEEEKKLRKQARENKQCQLSHKKYNSEIIQDKILKQAKDVLREFHHQAYRKESEAVNDFVSIFQKSSHYLSDTLKNKQSYAFAQQFCKYRKKKLDLTRDCEKTTSQNWNLYAQAGALTKTEPHDESCNDQLATEPRDNYKEKKKMFDLAQIYLQMVLEQQHRKKWNKNRRSQDQKFYSLSRKKANIANNNKNNNIQQLEEQRIMVDKNSSASQTQDTPTASSQFFKLRSQEPKKTTKMIRQKDIAIRKVNNFIQDLEEDEVCLKLEKKKHLWGLNELKKQIEQEDIYQVLRIWRDEEKYQQIKEVLQKQDQKLL